MAALVVSGKKPPKRLKARLSSYCIQLTNVIIVTCIHTRHHIMLFFQAAIVRCIYLFQDSLCVLYYILYIYLAP